MNKQNQWLFEAPPISEGDRHTNPYTNPEYYSNAEWEANLWKRMKNLAKKAATTALIAGSVALPSQTPTGKFIQDIAKVLTSPRKQEDERKKRLEGAPKNRKPIAGGHPPNPELEFEETLEFLQSTSPQVMMELLASIATEAETEAEATHLIRSILPVATSRFPLSLLLKQRILPQLTRILTLAVSLLYRDPKTRPLLRTLPTILKNTVFCLHQQVAQGQSVTPQTAIRIFQQQADKMLSNPQQLSKILQRSNTVLKNTIQSYRQKYEKEWLFEAPFK